MTNFIKSERGNAFASLAIIVAVLFGLAALCIETSEPDLTQKVASVKHYPVAYRGTQGGMWLVGDSE